MRLIRLLSIFILLSWIVPAKASRPEAAFGVKQNSLEWSRLEMEEWFATTISEELSQFVPEKLFKVYAEVEFKNRPRGRKTTSAVRLGKLGTIATFYDRPAPKPKTGLFSKVLKLNLTLVADYSVSPATVDTMLKVMKELVPIVDKSAISTSVHRIKSPNPSMLSWVSKFQYALTALVIGCLLILVLGAASKKVEFSSSFTLKPSRRTPKEIRQQKKTDMSNLLLAPIEQVFDEELELEDDNSSTVQLVDLIEQNEAMNMEENLVHSAIDPEEFYLFQNTQISISLRKIRAAFMSLSIDDCFKLAKMDTDLAAIMEMMVPKNKAIRVFSLLSDERRQEIIRATYKWDEKHLIERADEIIERVALFKKNELGNEEGSSELLGVYLEQLGPEKEEIVFRELLKRGLFETFENLAYDIPPSDSILSMPADIVGPYFMSLSFSDRNTLLSGFKDGRQLLFAHDLLELIEKQHPEHYRSHANTVKKLQKKPIDLHQKQEVQKVWNTLVASFRLAYKTEDDLKVKAKLRIKAWIAKKTSGIRGIDSEKKSA